MDMGMVGQRGAPCVEDCGQPDAGAEMLRVGGDGDQGLGGGLKEDGVDDGLILVGDVGDRRRQGEDDMVIFHRQQFGLSRRQQSLAAAPWHLGQWRLRQEL